MAMSLHIDVAPNASYASTVETAISLDVANMPEPDLVAILLEAEVKGLDKDQRHEVAERYRGAILEFKRYTDVLFKMGFTQEEYDSAMMQHAAKKARNYITRHEVQHGSMGRNQE